MVTATIHHGTVPLILSGPRPNKGPRGALDAATYELLVAVNTWQASAAELGFEYEQPLPDYENMWVKDLSLDEENDEVGTVKVSCIGLLEAGEKRKRRLTVAGREISVGPNEKIIISVSKDETGTDPDTAATVEVKRRVPKLDAYGEPENESIATISGTGERWNVREAILVVTDTYFVTERPSSILAGTAFTPPDAPDAPSSPWGAYDGITRGNSPNGWVLDDRSIEEHFCIDDLQGLWEVTDTCGYYFTVSPD